MSNRLPLWMYEATKPTDKMRNYGIHRNLWWHKMRLNHRLIIWLFSGKIDRREFTYLDKALWRFFWGGWLMLGAKDN